MRVRFAQASDAEFLWRLANDTREWSFSRTPIPWEDHLLWFARLMEDPDRTLVIGISESDERVGYVRFDRESTGSLVSIAIAADLRGGGLGRQLLDAAITLHGPGTYLAEVRSDNVASLNLFRHWSETAVDADRRRFVLDATTPPGPTTDAGS